MAYLPNWFSFKDSNCVKFGAGFTLSRSLLPFLFAHFLTLFTPLAVFTNILTASKLIFAAIPNASIVAKSGTAPKSSSIDSNNSSSSITSKLSTKSVSKNSLKPSISDSINSIISSERFIPFLTASKTLCPPLNPAGIPFSKLSKSFAAAAALILDADIPVTPSASGSRAPADTTLTPLSKL